VLAQPPASIKLFKLTLRSNGFAKLDVVVIAEVKVENFLFLALADFRAEPPLPCGLSAGWDCESESIKGLISDFSSYLNLLCSAVVIGDELR